MWCFDLLSADLENVPIIVVSERWQTTHCGRICQKVDRHVFLHQISISQPAGLRLQCIYCVADLDCVGAFELEPVILPCC